MGKFLAVLFLIFNLNAFGVEPEPGKVFFTVQVASFKEESKARQVLEKLKGLPYARISYRNGRYKVRVGFFKSFSEAEKFVSEKLSGKVRDYYITKIRFSPEGVFFAGKETVLKPEVSVSAIKQSSKRSLSHKTGEKSEKVSLEGKRVNSSETSKETPAVEETDYQVMKKAQEELKKTEVLINNDLSEGKIEEKKEKELEVNKNSSTVKEKEKKRELELEERRLYSSDNGEIKREKREEKGKFLSRGFLTFLIFGGVALSLIAIFTGLKGKKGAPPKDLEKLTAELLKEGKCEELLETVLPLLPSQPENTFLRKAVADCYVKLGKFLEAASLYEEIGEILDKKGLSVLSEEFKRKAEELYGKEFKGGR